MCDRGQLAREGRRFLLLALGLRGAYLLGNALAREAKLQVDGNEGEEGNGTHRKKPEVLVLLQEERDQDGEDHGAGAHDAKASDVGEGGHGPALLGIAR